MTKFIQGDLVWIPANTPLVYSYPRDESELFGRAIDKKEPIYGLVLSQDKTTLKVLIGEEQFYVQKKQVYGVENDY
jgi:hypothetical protein